MAKNDSLSSDIDLIKELEGLRIKQKLLVESLSKKSGEHENILLSHIDAKLEFLVKIFQDTSAPAPTAGTPEKKVDENGEEIIEENFESKLFERLESIENSMIARFDEMEEKISKLKTSQMKTQSSLPSENLTSNKLPPIPNFNEESKVKVDDSKSETELVEKIKDTTLDKNSETSQKETSESTEKKKKWF